MPADPTPAVTSRRALAEELLRARLRFGAERTAPVRHRGPAPLTYPQERLWLVEQMHPGRGAYHEVFAARLDGPLDADRLERALAAVVRRHEALRTSIRCPDGRPVQVVTDDVTVPLETESFPQPGMPAREEAALAAVRARVERPFDLTVAPLMRAYLARLDAERHILALVMHHVVTDGWSLRILLDEMLTHYVAEATGAAAALPALPLRYTDYAHEQRDRPPEERFAEGLRYWAEHLRGAPSSLQLPTDRDHPAVPTYVGGEHVFTVPSPLTAALRQLARREQATLFMVLLGAYAVLLSRLGGQEEVVVGTPVANRGSVATERLVGLLMNTIAIRTSLAGEPTFRQLLGRVRTVVAAGLRHGDVPFEKVVEAVGADREVLRNPLFQAMFVLHNAPFAAPDLPGVTVTALSGLTGTAKFDLTLGVVEAGDALECHLEYNSDVLDPATAVRLAGHYRSLLAGAVADPDRTIWDLDLLDAGQRATIEADWYPPTAAPMPVACLHDAFAAQAARTPDAPAVVDGARRVTYGELKSRVDALATRLRRHGVRRGTLVALQLERGLEQVTGILGVLTAGGAYVPIDPDEPPERLRYILAETSPVVLLVRQAPDAAAYPDGPLILAVDGDITEPAGPTEPADDGAATEPAEPGDLAYVIYTSGSTGRPKGVPVAHRNVAWLFRAARERVRFDPGDVWTMFHAYTFDVSVWELFGALLHGGTLVIVPREVSRSPAALRRLLAEQRVTVLCQTPTAFYGLADADADAGGTALDALRMVFVGGERLEFGRLAGWFSRYGDEVPQVFNMYGPTEATVWTTWRDIVGADTGIARSRIGRPLAGAGVLVVDHRLRPVPPGVPGELVLGGPPLSQGYLNRPELTAERFVADPLGGDRRGYRTGDVVRRLADGDLEYLGRADLQVKIRGHRVEPGEVEAAMREHSQVAEAVVVAGPDPAGGDRLIGYVVAAGDAAPAAGELRDFLRRRLPAYMVPSAFVAIPAIPLTTSGKTDRRALPPPDAETVRTGPYVAPRTPVERLLATIFAELLGVARIGIDDNFFDLGGHSVLALRLHQRMRAEALPVEVISIFQYPTVRTLAGLLDRDPAGAAALGRARDRGAERRTARTGRAVTGPPTGGTTSERREP
ncbi:amino acid adenylation domain-containing protein [Micromonospora sp. NPDC048898]|uniref:non-ribosomal peptide synthetase n=1 Tax=Micromonospora sp. NPDC048898 TaxID=3364260 RepID=UPI00371C093D